MDVRNQKIAKNLRDARKRAGYKSAKEFAIALGLNPLTYQEYETRIKLSVDMACRIADFLDMSLDELVGHEVKRENWLPPTKDEQELLNNYRELDEGRKQSLQQTAHDGAELLKNKVKY